LKSQYITIWIDWVGFCVQVAKTPTYPVICPFSLVVALCDHNPPSYRRIDRQRDRHHVVLKINWRSCSGEDHKVGWTTDLL